MNSPYQSASRLIIGLLLISLSNLSNAIELGKPAPDFTLKSNSGKNIKLKELRGEVILLNFWASWCGPCRQEMPYLEDLQKKYSPLGFTVLGVNVDEDIDNGKGLLKEIPVTFPVVFDSNSKISELYKVSGMPNTVLIDRNGIARHLHLGYKPGYEKKYEQEIKKLIRE